MRLPAKIQGREPRPSLATGGLCAQVRTVARICTARRRNRHRPRLDEFDETTREAWETRAPGCASSRGLARESQAAQSSDAPPRCVGGAGKMGKTGGGAGEK